MHLLWDYLLTMPAQMIQIHFEGMVFLPTLEGTLSRLRPAMPVLLTMPDEEEEPPPTALAAATLSSSSSSSNSINAINAILRLLGIRTVDRGLYQEGKIKMLSPAYLMPPSRTGMKFTPNV